MGFQGLQGGAATREAYQQGRHEGHRQGHHEGHCEVRRDTDPGQSLLTLLAMSRDWYRSMRRGLMAELWARHG